MQVDHQIWLLRNVIWWYLLPCNIVCLLFPLAFALGPMASRWKRMMIPFLLTFSLVALTNWIVYRMNQSGVRKELLPRKQELESLRDSLESPEDQELCAGSEGEENT